MILLKTGEKRWENLAPSVYTPNLRRIRRDKKTKEEKPLLPF